MLLMQTPRAVRVFARIGAWGSVAAIAFVTLSPIENRPTIADIRLEHAGAFAVVGLLFGIAYPKRLVPVILTVAGAAAALELAQHIAPGRHGRLDHFALKAFGGALGIALAALADWRLTHWQRRGRTPAIIRFDR